MYTAEITVTHLLTGRVYAVHRVEGAASAAGAFKAAEALSSNIEYLYPCYTNYDIKVFGDGKLVDENEYSEC